MIYTFKVEHKYQFEALIEMAKFKNFTICEAYLEEGWGRWPIFQFSAFADHGYHVVGGQYQSASTVVVKSFERMIEILFTEVTESIELTNDYTAVLDRKNHIVKVGCQEIPFSKVEELYKLINKNK